ncbi:hypothetical protein Q3G72_012238 [Acer saccharum]|nr:hypothetical protein Q3G72_012238 [Acer saccharum]
MKCNEFLAGGSMRVRGMNVSFNAMDVNERLEIMSYPYYSLFLSHHRHTITLGPAVLFYLMKMELPFDVDTVAIKRIAEAGRTNVPSTKAYNEVAVPIGFPKLESEKLKKRRLQREIREANKASVVAGIGTGGEPSASRDVPPPRRATAPRGSSEQVPDWGEHYTPPPAYELSPSSYPHLFDPAAEFQTMSQYSPTALIPYPTPLNVAKPTRDQSNPDVTNFETSSD